MKSVSRSSILHAVFIIFLLVSIFSINLIRDTGIFDKQEDGTIISTEASDIVVDHNGDIIVVGYSQSDDFPLMNPKQDVRRGGSDVIISKYDSDLNLLWSTFLGGSKNDKATAVSVDANNNIIIAGSTASTDFPGTNGTYEMQEGSFLLFLTKISSQGGNPIWSNVFGGSYSYFDVKSFEIIRGLLPSKNGGTIIYGETYNIDYLGRNKNDLLNSTNPQDLFIQEFSYSGQLLWSKFLAGTWHDEVFKIVENESNELLITGCGSPEIFVHYNGFNSSRPVEDISVFDINYSLEVKDVFIAKLSPSGELISGDLIGGSGYDCASDIKIDQGGNIFITGSTRSHDFEKSIKNSYNGGYNDIFVSKLNSDLDLIWTKIIGGDELDGLDRDIGGSFLEIGSDNMIYLVSMTHSDNLAVTNANFEYRGLYDLYVFKLDQDGNEIWSRYIGGASNDIPNATVYLDGLVVVGYTESDDYPQSNARERLGFREGFLTTISDDGEIVRSILL